MRIKQARIWLCYCLLSGTLGAACGGDLGNSISTGGGVTSFGGTQANGGGGQGGSGAQGGSAGAAGAGCPQYVEGLGCTTIGADCPTKAEQDCTSKNNCVPIHGYPSGNVATNSSVYVGCMSTVVACFARNTCANPAGHPENCMFFYDGCIPAGWTESVSCPLPGC